MILDIWIITYIIWKTVYGLRMVESPALFHYLESFKARHNGSYNTMRLLAPHHEDRYSILHQFTGQNLITYNAARTASRLDLLAIRAFESNPRISSTLFIRSHKLSLMDENNREQRSWVEQHRPIVSQSWDRPPSDCGTGHAGDCSLTNLTS